MKTVIMAGGKGSRISEAIPNIPKPLIKVCGVPILEREIICLRNQGFTEIIITVSHLADQIIDYFGDGRKLGVSIEYFVEERPLGNAGALVKMREMLKEPFLLLNADALFDVDFKRFVSFHFSHGGLVTLFTHPNDHPYDSGLIISNVSNEVIQWLSKEDERPKWYKNRVNAGLHVIDPSVLDAFMSNDVNIGLIHGNDKIDLDRQILKPLCGTRKMFCYDSPEYVKDMGTPERYKEVCDDFLKGIVHTKNLLYKQKAVFLDRDGTINEYVGFLNDINKFKLLPGVAEAIRRINQSGYLAIVVTNQPVIARGEVSVEELQQIHNKMETLLGIEGAYLNAIFYCPHHPHKGYEGEVAELKIECDCRKPKPGMLLLAAEKLNVELSKSWMIGDGKNDVEAGKAAGCMTALIGENEYGQDLTVDSILDWCNKCL